MVEIEEFYDVSASAQAGAQINEGSIALGLGAEGKSVTKRIYQFKGFREQSVLLGDILQAGFGNTLMVAGSGADLFAFTRGSASNATISGFSSGADEILLQGFAATSPPSTSVSGGNLVVSLSDGTRITLVGISHLNPGDVTVG